MEEHERSLQHILNEANIVMNSLRKELSDWHIDLTMPSDNFKKTSNTSELGEKEQVISELTQHAETPEQQEP